MNYHLFQLVNGWAGRSDGLDDIMEFAATWLIYVVFLVGAVLVVRVLRRGGWADALAVGVTLAVAFLGSLLLQRISHEVRPFQTHAVHQLIPHAAGASLPSDHATAAFAIAFAALAFLDRRWGWGLLGAAVIIGLARVWAGLHYPGDILAAAIIAGLAALEVKTAMRWFFHLSHTRRHAQVR